MIELTPEQRQAVEHGEAVRVVDSATRDALVVVRAEVFARIASGTQRASEKPPLEIPPRIRRSQEAFRRELPGLLRDRRTFHQWIAYHGDQRVGISSTAESLQRECLRRGLQDDEYYIGWIDASELLDEEDVGPRRPEWEETTPRS